MNDEEPKVSVEDPKGKQIRVRCHECEKDAQKATVMSEVTQVGAQDLGGGQSVDWQERFQVLQCGGCGTIFFRHTASNSEDFEIFDGPDGQPYLSYNITERIYPEKTAERRTFKDFGLLPERLRAIYSEAAQALYSNQPVLAGIGIRAIIETICKDKTAPGNTLNDKINGLVQMGVLAPDGAVVLHKLRVLGNNAAHEVVPHPEDQLSLGFDVIDNVLANVYVLLPKATQIF